MLVYEVVYGREGSVHVVHGLLEFFVFFFGDFYAFVLFFLEAELASYGVADEIFTRGVAEVLVLVDEVLGFVEQFRRQDDALAEEVFYGVRVSLHLHGLGGDFADERGEFLVRIITYA